METWPRARMSMRTAPSRRLIVLALATALLTVLGCSSAGIFPKENVREMSNPEFRGPDFRTLGLIAGDDSQGTIAMTSRIREKLEDADLTVLQTPGRWEAEVDALGAICSMQSPEPDGVIFVRWDRINLRACAGERFPQAYEAEGEYVGVRKLADRLLEYLRVPREG